MHSGLEAVLTIGFTAIGIYLAWIVLFESGDKGSQDAAERIAHLEQLVGRLTVELDIHKKAKALLREKADLNAEGGTGSPECL